MKETCKPSVNGVRYDTIAELKEKTMSGPRALLANKIFSIYASDTSTEKGTFADFLSAALADTKPVKSTKGVLAAVGFKDDATERDTALALSLYRIGGFNNLTVFKEFLSEGTPEDIAEKLSKNISLSAENKTSAKINRFTLSQLKNKLKTTPTNTEVAAENVEEDANIIAKKQAAQTLLSKIDDNSKLLIKDETGEVVGGLYKWYLMKTKSLDEVVDLLENGRLVEDTSETFGLKWYRYYKLNDDGTKTYIESDPSYRAYYEATVGKKSPDEVLNARTLLTLEMQKKDLMGRPLWNVVLPETILPSFSRTAFDIPKGTSLYNIIGTDGNDLLNAAKFFRRDARIQRRFKPFKLGPVIDVRRYYASKAATEIFDGINTAILNAIKDIETPEFSIETINEVNKLIIDSKQQEINNTARSFVDSLKVILAHIPGQSKQSGIPSQVVEFLDSQGNMAMSPTESMVTTGGDYDIDTFSVATFALDSVGKIIASSEDLYEDQEYDKRQIVAIYKDRLRKINQVIRKKVDYLNAEIDAYIDTLDPIADVEKISSAEKSKKGEEDIELMVKKAEKSLHGLFKDILTNRVLQSMIDSLSNPATQVEVNTAMSMDIFKPQLEKVKKVAQKPAKAEVSMGMKTIEYSDEVSELMPAFYKTESGNNIVNLGPTSSEVESFLPPFTIFNDIPAMPRVGTEDISLADYKKAVDMPSKQQMTEEDIAWRNEILDKANQNNLALIAAYKEWLMWNGEESSVEGPSAEDPTVMTSVSMDIASERREFIKNNISLTKFTGTATIPKEYNIYGKHFGNVLKEIIQDSSEYRASGETYGNIFMSENLAAQGDVSIGVYATTLKITGSVQTAEMYFNAYYNKLTKQNNFAPVYNPFKFNFTLKYKDSFTGKDMAITRNKFVDNDRFAITKQVVDNPETLKSIFNVVSETSLVTENIDSLLNILLSELTDSGATTAKDMRDRIEALFGIVLEEKDLEASDMLTTFREYLINNPAKVGQAFSNVIGKPIGTDAQSQFLSAATDNAKELILGRIRATTLTNSAITTMLVLGYDIGTIIDFIHSKEVDDVFKLFEKQVGDLQPVSVTKFSVSNLKGASVNSPSVMSLMDLLEISSEIQKFRGVRSLNENSTVDTSQIQSILSSLDIETLRQAVITDNINILGTPEGARGVFSPEHMIFLQPQARYMFENVLNREQAIARLFKSTSVASAIMGEIKKTPEAFKNADRYIHDLQISTFYSKPIGENEAGLPIYKTGTITTPSGKFTEKTPLNTHANRAVFVRQFGHYLAYVTRALSGEDPATVHALSTIVPGVMSRVDTPVYYMPKLKTRDNSIDSSIAIMALRQLQASTGNQYLDTIKKDLYNNLSNYALIVSSGTVKKGSMIEAFEEISLELAKHIQTLSTENYAAMVPENVAVRKLIVGDIHSEARTIDINAAAEKRKPKQKYSDEDQSDFMEYEEATFDMTQEDVMFEDEDGGRAAFQTTESAKRLNKVVDPENILVGSIFSVPSKLLKKDLFYAHTQEEIAYRLFKVDAAEAVPGSMEPTNMVIPNIHPDFIRDLEKTPYRLGYPARYNGYDARVLAYAGQDSTVVDGVPLTYSSYLIVTEKGTYNVSGEVLMVQNPGHLFYKNAIQKISVSNRVVANRMLESIHDMGEENIKRLSSIAVEKGSAGAGEYANLFSLEQITTSQTAKDELKAIAIAQNIINMQPVSRLIGDLEILKVYSKDHASVISVATSEDVSALVPSVEPYLDDKITANIVMNNFMSEVSNRINDIVPGYSFSFYAMALPKAVKSSVVQSGKAIVDLFNSLHKNGKFGLPEDVFFSSTNKKYYIAEGIYVEITQVPKSSMYEIKVSKTAEPAIGEYRSSMLSNGNEKRKAIPYTKDMATGVITMDNAAKVKERHKVEFIARGLMPGFGSVIEPSKAKGYHFVKVGEDMYLISDRDGASPEYNRLLATGEIIPIDDRQSTKAVLAGHEAFIQNMNTIIESNTKPLCQ